MKENGILKLANGITWVQYDDFPTLDTSIQYIFIPNGCFYIGEYAFRNFPELEGIWLPESLTLISETAMSGLDKLKYILVHNMQDCSGGQSYKYYKTFYEKYDLFSTYCVARMLEKYRIKYHKDLDIISVKKNENVLR